HEQLLPRVQLAEPAAAVGGGHRWSMTALEPPVKVGAMLLREVEYARPDTIDEAVRLLSSREDARVLAGGQSLVNVMKTRVAAPELVVDLNRIQELREIST